MPQADIEQQLTQFQNQLKTYIDNQNPTATVGQVLGLQAIKIIPARPLAAGLPYHRIITSQNFVEVPDTLRHKFKYSLATQIGGYPGDAFISVEEPTAKLAGKTLALSFKPATKADEDIIASRLPVAGADGKVNPASVQNSFPGYSIKLIAEFSIAGQVVAQGNAGNMGIELSEELGLWNPHEGWKTSINNPATGEYRAIGLDLQGANLKQAARLAASYENTIATLNSHDSAKMATLSKQELVGNLFYGTILEYFAFNDMHDKAAAKAGNLITYRAPSYGIFSTKLMTHYFFGVPRTVDSASISMDVDGLVYQSASKTEDSGSLLTFMQVVGSYGSALEHLIPEHMFSNDSAKIHAISAVKAIALASDQGQKIWTINSTNLELALGSIQLDEDAKSDIRNAVNAGKVVTTHSTDIHYLGWVGCGYTILDPETGAGAYIISGGNNGSWAALIWEAKAVLGELSTDYTYLGVAVTIASLVPTLGGAVLVAPELALGIGIAFAAISILSLVVNCETKYQGVFAAAQFVTAATSVFFTKWSMMLRNLPKLYKDLERFSLFTELVAGGSDFFGAAISLESNVACDSGIF